MRQARRLFAKALETPGGLKIQTIHAFCERLLHEFPFEANVPGQFAVLDDSAAASLIAAARADVMNSAAAEPDSPLGQAVRYMAEHANDEQIGQALDAVIRQRDALRRWTRRPPRRPRHGDIEDALADLRRRLGLADGETEEIDQPRDMPDSPLGPRALRRSDRGAREIGKPDRSRGA